MAISGLSVVGRDKFGVYPLKGKIINVKDKKILTKKGYEWPAAWCVLVDDSKEK